MSISQTAKFGKPDSKFVKIFVKLEKQASISTVQVSTTIDSNLSTSQHFDEIVYLLSHTTWLLNDKNPSDWSLMKL